MIVCVCHRVSDRVFRESVHQGLTFEDLQVEHGVATRCGRCESCARSLWQTLGGAVSEAGGCMGCAGGVAAQPACA